MFYRRIGASHITPACLLLATLATCEVGFAELITFTYTGVVEDALTQGFADFDADDAPFDAFNGEQISLSFTFDSDLSDSNPSANGDYASIANAEISLGANTYTGTNFGSITIINNGVNPDQYIVNGVVSGPSLTGAATYDEMFLALILTDNTQSVFATDDLPLTAPDPNLFTSSQLRIDFSDSSNFDNFGFVGTNTVSAVPEPSSAILLIASLAALALRRRRS